MRTRSLTRLVLCLLVMAGFSALASADATAALRKNWQIQRLAGVAGSGTTMSGINNTGVAVGTMALSDGSSHGVVFDRKRFRDVNSKLGAASSIAAVNDRNQYAGWRSTNAKASLVDFLLNRGDPASQPHAFFHSGKTLKVRSEPSIATSVNILGLVTGRFRAADGQLHAFAWQAGGKLPKRNAKSAGVIPDRFVDLGVGAGNEVDHNNYIVGNMGAAAGHWDWEPKTGDWSFRPAGFNGTLYSKDGFGAAVGARDLPNGQFEPVTLTLPNTNVRRLPLPSSTQPQDGLVRGIAPGFFFGFLHRQDGSSGPLLWNNKGQPVDIQSLLAPSVRMQLTVTNVGDVDWNGLMTGSVRLDQTTLHGFVLFPPPLLKFAYLARLARHGTRSDKRQLRRLAAVAKLLRQNKVRRACRSLRSIRKYFDREYDFADSDWDAGYIDEVGATLWELEGELGCPRRIRLSLPPAAL